MRKVAVKCVSAAVCCLAAGIVFGNVYDDAFWWFNQPRDGGTVGTLEAKEVADALRYGDPSHGAHNSSVDGYADSRCVVTEVVSNAYFAKSLPVAQFKDIVQDGNKYPASVPISTCMSNSRGTVTDGFSMAARFKWDGNSHGTAWLVNCGRSHGTYNFMVGVVSGKIRTWPNMASGGASGCPELSGIAAGRWYDVGVAITRRDGGNLLRIILVDDAGTVKIYEEDAYSAFPSQSTDARIAAESFKSKAASPEKYFTGSIQQVAFWNRALSYGEFKEAFKVAVHDKELVGVANGSGLEFGGTAGNVQRDLDADNWNLFPRTMGAADVWTLTFTLGADYGACGRNLVVKPVGGNVGFSATLNGATTATASSAGGSEAALFFAADAFREGVNTIVLSRTDGGDSFTLDAMRVEEKAYVYPDGATVTDDLVIPEGTRMTFDVGTGEVVRYAGRISGGGELVKVGGGTLCLLNEGNSYSGGTHVKEGFVQTAGSETKTSSLGTGAVTVEAGAQVKVGCSLDNDFVINGDASASVPALYFDSSERGGVALDMNGAVTLSGTCRLATGWAGVQAKADSEFVAFRGSVTGGKLVGGPHCRVRFAGPVALDELEGDYDEGNLGAFVLGNASTAIGTLTIDQTRVIVDANIDFQNTTLKFTGAHLEDGRGCFEMNGHAVKVKTVAVVNTPGVGDPGCQIINSVSALRNFEIAAQSGKVYAKLDGYISFPTASITFAPRHHTMCGSLSGAKTFEGGSISNVVAIYFSSSHTVRLDYLCEGGLASVRTIGSNGSGNVYVKSCQFTPYRTTFDLAGMHSTTYKNSSNISIMDDGVLKAKAFKYYDWQQLWSDRGWTAESTGKSNSSTYQKYASPGTYDDGGPNGCGQIHASSGGKIEVFGPAESGVTITYVGTDGDLAKASNWLDENGDPLAEAPNLETPIYSPVFGNGGSATIVGDVSFASLRLSGGFTFNGVNGTIHVGNGISVEDAPAAGTTYVFEPKIDCVYDTYVQIPSNATFTVLGGFVGVGKLTLDGSGQPGCTHQDDFGTVPDAGVFNLNGISTCRGIVVTNAIAYLRGQLGTPGDDSQLTVYACPTSKGGISCLRLCGADVYKGISIDGLGQSDVNAASSVVMTPGSTNRLYGAFVHDVVHTIQFRGGSVTHFNGGMSDYWGLNLRMYKDEGLAPELHFASKMEIAADVNDQTRLLWLGGADDVGATVSLDPGICGTVGILNVHGHGVTVECNVDYPFNIKRWMSNLAVDEEENPAYHTTLKLNGTRFATPWVRVYPNGVIHGVGEGAAFEITNAKESGHLNSVFQGRVTGTADLVMKGTNTLSYQSRTSTSTGTLRAESGTIEIGAQAVWPGDIRVTGGRLAIVGAMKLAEDQALYAPGLSPAPRGVYGAIGSGMQHEVPWITSGRLVIGTPGAMLIIR